MFGFKKPNKTNTIEEVETVKPTVLDLELIKAKYQSKIPYKTYEIKYEEALSELKLKFLLALNDHPDEWYLDLNSIYAGSDGEALVYKDIFYILNSNKSFEYHTTIGFYATDVRRFDDTSIIHNYYTRCSISLTEENPTSDDLVNAYIKISNRIRFEDRETIFCQKLNDIQHILKKC